MNKEIISAWFKDLQNNICADIEKCDGKATFKEELWKHHEEGGGQTRILQKGAVLEKAGVNFSAVGGKLNPSMQQALKLKEADFFACGVSIVMHPVSPMVPIIHMNVRYFETPEGYWFGGGIDLTPHYIFDEDAKYFHSELKKVCDRYDASAYEKYKQWADDYFYNNHRQETRGIGGIFFDRLNEHESGRSKAEIWQFVQELGSTFSRVYIQLIQNNKSKPYSENEQHWQAIRRGRYVEFNLVYDKGTKFGFETGGRTESILMSLPPMAEWVYQYEPEKNSPEAHTLSLLKKGISWV